MRLHLLLGLLWLANPVLAASPGLLPKQALDTPSPRVSGEEFSRRLLSPIAADDVARFLQSQGRGLAPEPFAAGREQVDLYVPANMPEAGYGLVVFVPPGDEFALPRDWRPTLDRKGLVFASLRDAGNDADVIGRRIPLALHAQQHVADRYRIDPARVYIAGFSGGARLAQRIALAWPDLFTGSLQFAGSVVVGSHLLPPPPVELMDLFQQRSRVVLVSGNLDLPNRRNDALTRAGLRGLCVAGERGMTPARLDHWVPDGRAFARSVDLLEAPVEPGSDQAACRQALQQAIAADIAAAAAEAASGRRERAVALLVAVDDRYGGLAAPASLELARKMLAERAPDAD